ncbi:MAG TPA: YidC/Oxa1 family membrane protein insertase, partial [Bacillota bacterium]
LPLLIQLPFLWAFFAALRGYDFRADPSFLWIADLARPDLWVLPILSGLTTYLMTRMTSSASGDPSQRVMLYAMPVFIGWVTRSFPAGLGVYWVTSNLFQILQQYWMAWMDRRAVKGEAG